MHKGTCPDSCSCYTCTGTRLRRTAVEDRSCWATADSCIGMGLCGAPARLTGTPAQMLRLFRRVLISDDATSVLKPQFLVFHKILQNYWTNMAEIIRYIYTKSKLLWWFQLNQSIGFKEITKIIKNIGVFNFFSKFSETIGPI